MRLGIETVENGRNATTIRLAIGAFHCRREAFLRPKANKKVEEKTSAYEASTATYHGKRKAREPSIAIRLPIERAEPEPALKNLKEFQCGLGRPAHAPIRGPVLILTVACRY